MEERDRVVRLPLLEGEMTAEVRVAQKAELAAILVAPPKSLYPQVQNADADQASDKGINSR